MRLAPWAYLWIACLPLLGCGPFGKKNLTVPGGMRGGSDPGAAPHLDRSDPTPPPNWTESPPGPVPGANSLLAGQVVDAYGRRPPTTYIQLKPAPQAGDPAPGAPIEVAADPNGYFTIQGLQAGRHYQLIARAHDGERLLAGTTWATPPNPKVIIRISEDFASPQTPPLPPPPAYPGNGPAPGSGPAPAPVWPDAGSSPARSTNPQRRPAELGTPIGSDDPDPEPRSVVRPENIAQDQNRLASDIPLRVRPQATRPQVTPTPPAVVPAVAAAQVPSCVLTGNTLHNFALTDLSGRPWEFRQHRGKLVLIDFWGTWCIPCQQAVPHLKALQQTYGRYGLEVIGIAYEEDSPMQQAQQVQRVSQRLGINYRLLLGSDRATCPVRSQFHVTSWPTLVLLDENGRVLTRKEGTDRQHFREIEMIIRQRLGFR